MEYSYVVSKPQKMSEGSNGIERRLNEFVPSISRKKSR